MADSEAMKPVDLLRSAADDARLLLAAARSGWERTVPDCPGWDAADLVRHQGGIFAWMAAVVTSGQRVSRRGLAPAPAEAAELPGWYLDSLDQAIDVPAEWWIDLGAGGRAVREHARADTAVRGTRSELLLFLTNRGSSGALDVLGRQEVLDEWKQLRR